MGEAATLPPRLSLWKKACFALLVTVSFFIALECVLALLGVQPPVADADPYVGFESSLPLFTEADHGDQVVMETAANKLRYFNVQRFSKVKAPGTLRVFCLGGSTTFGRPFDDRTSYVGWLRELLPAADQSTRWEVINAGGVSYASYRVASAMDELAKYSPDLFIVYTGHNEFLEERTYGDVKNVLSTFCSLTLPLAHSRSLAVAQRLFPSNLVDEADAPFLLPDEVDTLLDHSVGPDNYYRDDHLRTQIVDHFEFNLHRMVDTAKSAGAKLVLVKPASNMSDFSPFKSQATADLEETQAEGTQQRWSQLIAAAKSAEAAGDLEQAIICWKQARELDARRADVHYTLAKLLHSQGRFSEAHTSFQSAIDEDVCPLRAVSEIQQAVERVAIERGVPLVDFQSIVGGACRELHGHDNPGRDFFVDHVHPTIAAHRLLSLALIEAMSRSGVLDPHGQASDQAIASATSRIESRIDYELQARALTNLAQVLSWAGKQDEAGPIAEQALRLRAQTNLGEDPEGMFYAAVSFAVKGRDTEAIGLLERVVTLEPRNSQARWRLAALLYDQLRFEESLDHFREAVRLDPRDRYSHHMLGTVLIKLHRYNDALVVLTQASELAPNDPFIRENLEIVRKAIAGS